ncbi:hypothetical protein E2C01_054886 [Portunus trituberculatus]|uniref:Uncharacterized protein n=1 Tax=Portunus trituberculatus TaxID=210409 RepID=A0A5B7GV50_PORTR|nr:hypothetical protein [Portunus trituberculatus]
MLHIVTSIPTFPHPKALIPLPTLPSATPLPSPRGQTPSKPLACETRGALAPAFPDKQFEAEFLIHTLRRGYVLGMTSSVTHRNFTPWCEVGKAKEEANFYCLRN